MASERDTWAQYNDDMLNNAGTFVWNELLGADDFQRTFSDMGDPNVSFWDRAKSLGTGVGELGLTAALFVPGANLAAGAARAGTLGAKAAKALPFIAPATRGERAFGLSALGAQGGSQVLPDDSGVGQALGWYGTAAEPAYLGKRFLSNRSAKKAAATAAAGGADEAAQTGGALSRAMQAARTKRGMAALGLGTAVGGAATLGAAQMAGARGTLPSYVQDYYGEGGAATAATEDKQAGVADPILAAITGNYEAQRALVEAQRARALRGLGDDRMATVMDFINRYETIADAQGNAVQGEFNSLADRYGIDVGEIAAAGQAGAGGVNEVYGRAASRTRRRNRRPGPAGRTAVSGMTPVSGVLADAPGDMTARGRTLADYVAGQAEIAARDAGYDAASAREYGSALANTMSQDAAIAALAAEMGAKSDIQAQREALAQDYNDMLLGLQMKEAADRGDVQRMLAESEVAKQMAAEDALTVDDVMSDGQLLTEAMTEFETLKTTEEGKAWLESKGIRSLNDFISYDILPDKSVWVPPVVTAAPAPEGSFWNTVQSPFLSNLNPVSAGMSDAQDGGMSPTLPIPPLYLLGQAIGRLAGGN
jgi:hypothetical protein